MLMVPMRLTLCGSTRFRSHFEDWNQRLSKAGHVVYSVASFGHSGDRLTMNEKATLDRVHLAKIDNSDAIVVLNVGGHIGESTSREIDHAERAGKAVFFLETGLNANDADRLLEDDTKGASDT